MIFFSFFPLFFAFLLFVFFLFTEWIFFSCSALHSQTVPIFYRVRFVLSMNITPSTFSTRAADFWWVQNHSKCLLVIAFALPIHAPEWYTLVHAHAQTMLEDMMEWNDAQSGRIINSIAVIRVYARAHACVWHAKYQFWSYELTFVCALSIIRAAIHNWVQC